MSARALLLLLLLLPAAAAADGSRVVICLEDAATERAGAKAVDRWLATTEIDVAPPPCPAPAPGQHVGRFVERGGKVYFRLEAAGRHSLERGVPWLSSAVAPLTALQQRGRSSEFSVVVEALIAEHQLALIWGPMEPVIVEPPEVAAGPAAPIAVEKEQPKQGSFRRSTRRRGEKAKGKAAPKKSAQRSGGSGERGAAAGGPGLASGGAGNGAEAGGAVAVGVVPEPVAEPIPAPVPTPEPEAPAAAADGGSGTAPSDSGTMPPDAIALLPEPPRLPGIEEAAAAARRPVLDFRAPEPAGLPFRVSAAGGFRLRSPGVAAPEVGIEVELGAAWLRGAWQPEVEWDLGGYPVAVEGLSLEGGLRVLLLSGRLWGLRGHAGVAVDRMELRPLYRPFAASSPGWDIGPTAGTTFGWLPLPGLELGLAAAAQWMPTAGITHVGELGPSARFNALGARLGLELAWRR